MAYTGKLTKGSRTLQLDGSGRLALSRDFIPPGTLEVANIVAGGAGNIYGAAQQIGKYGSLRAMTLPVIVRGSNKAEVGRGVDDLLRFLQLAGDPDEPLLLHYRDDADLSFEPVWGTLGVFRRIEIISVTDRSLTSDHGVTVGRGGTLINVGVIIRPYFSGRRMRLANATGGVQPDMLGTVDGQARGMLILPARTNYFTNPIFGNADFDNDWAAEDATISVYLNKDKDFIAFGEASAKVVNTAIALKNLTQSVTLPDTGQYVLVAYIKQLDGGLIDSSDLFLYYGGNISANVVYNSLGDGYYQVWVNVTGIAAPTAAGVVLAARRTFYLAGVSIQKEAYPSYPVVGGFIGCAWAGTAHDSTSTRVAGRLRFDPTDIHTTIEEATGTLLLALKMGKPSTAANDHYLFSNGATKLRALYNATDDKFYFTDNVNYILTAAQTFSTGDILFLGFSWNAYYLNAGQLLIYKNGVLAASNSQYDPASVGSTIYIGSDDSAANQFIGTVMGSTYFDRALTAAEHLALYNQAAALIADGDRVDWLPCLWTDGGDLILDNQTAPGKANYGAIMDVPGDMAPELLLFGKLGGATTFANIGSVWLSILQAEQYHDPYWQMFVDQSGTVDAAACGGEKKVTSVDTTATIIGAEAVITKPEGAWELLGKEFIMLVRLTDAGSNLQLAGYFSVGNVILGEYKPVTAGATMYLFSCRPLYLPRQHRLFADMKVEDAAVSFRLYGKRSSGAAANVAVDYYAIFPRPWVQIKENPSSGAATMFIYDSDQHRAGGGLASTMPEYVVTVTDFELPVIGHPLEVLPDKVNIIQALLGDADSDPVITYTVQLIGYITPRWSIA